MGMSELKGEVYVILQTEVYLDAADPRDKYTADDLLVAYAIQRRCSDKGEIEVLGGNPQKYRVRAYITYEPVNE